MLNWISQHSSALTVIANFGILAVWLFYAQILLNGVLRQRRPRLLINQGKGQDLSSEILVANMSQEGIFIQMLLAVVETEDDSFTRPITDVSIYDNDDAPDESRRTTSQGPLSSGSYMRLGSFRDVARWVSPADRQQPVWRSLEIRVIFFYSGETDALAASRRFLFTDDDIGERDIRAESRDTHLLNRRHHRRKVQRWLRENG